MPARLEYVKNEETLHSSTHDLDYPLLVDVYTYSAGLFHSLINHNHLSHDSGQGPVDVIGTLMVAPTPVLS